MPDGTRWVYVITTMCGLILLPGAIAFIDIIPDGRERRQVVAAGLAAMVTLSLASLVRPSASVWSCLTIVAFGLLLHDLIVIQTYAFSAWLDLAIAGAIPLTALWSARPVRK